MFLLIKNNMTYPAEDDDFICYQYGGYDYNVSGRLDLISFSAFRCLFTYVLMLTFRQVPGCAIVGYWPQTWEGEIQVSGSADMTGASLTIPSDTPYTWEICIGNGWRECPVDVGYVGNVTACGLDTTDGPPTPVQQPTQAPTLNPPTLHPVTGPVALPTFVPTENGNDDMSFEKAMHSYFQHIVSFLL